MIDKLYFPNSLSDEDAQGNLKLTSDLLYHMYILHNTYKLK